MAVVGTRLASPEKARIAPGHLRDLVDHGLHRRVAGWRAESDRCAHRRLGARRAKTLAVIGTGLARSYPPQNARLQRRIASQCAVVSQFWPDAPPSRRSFPMRNAVISGLTLATVVVEASQTGGSRIQARLALAQGRPVFLPTWAARCTVGQGARSQARCARGRFSGGDHGDDRASDLVGCADRIAPRVPTVGELTELYSNFMLGPRVGPDVCTTCFNFTRGYQRCYACAHGQSWLQAVAPVSYSIAREQLHHALASYKRLTGEIARRFQVELAAILWRFLAEHEQCVARAAGAGAFALVTTVPSGDRERDRKHPLRQIVGELVVPHAGRHERLLQRSTVRLGAREPSP